MGAGKAVNAVGLTRATGGRVARPRRRVMAPETAAAVQKEGATTEGRGAPLGPAVGSVPRDGEGPPRSPR